MRKSKEQVFRIKVSKVVYDEHVLANTMEEARQVLNSVMEIDHMDNWSNIETDVVLVKTCSECGNSFNSEELTIYHDGMDALCDDCLDQAHEQDSK